MDYIFFFFFVQAISFTKKASTEHVNNMVLLTIVMADLLQLSPVQQYTSHLSSPDSLHVGFLHPFADWHPRMNVSSVTLDALM